MNKKIGQATMTTNKKPSQNRGTVKPISTAIGAAHTGSENYNANSHRH